MKDPRFPTYVADLLEAERAAPPPGRDAHDRVRARVAATVLAATAVGAAGSAAAAGATTAGVAATKGAGAGLLATVAAKATLVAVAVTATGLTGAVVVHRQSVRAEAVAVTARHAPAPRTVPSPAVLVEAPPPAPIEAPPPPVAAAPPAPNAPSRPAARAPAARAAQTASALADENALVDGARAALDARAPTRAAALLERHARLHPHGQMEEEREALWVQTLVAAGDGPGARARAQAFRQRFPRSIQLDVVAAALETIP